VRGTALGHSCLLSRGVEKAPFAQRGIRTPDLLFSSPQDLYMELMAQQQGRQAGHRQPSRAALVGPSVPQPSVRHRRREGGKGGEQAHLWSGTKVSRLVCKPSQSVSRIWGTATILSLSFLLTPFWNKLFLLSLNSQLGLLFTKASRSRAPAAGSLLCQRQVSSRD
jgi:hypothetical protein